ncbi:hypothetical protein [Epilithonimonas arachidiradicis]|uniref:Uncharacterized protein n=2 Tax=Epilithonimonas arachidiradicis TaxID=1617282 RepID=A0A420DAP1_9FLAO|nr:hypothetical protein [Epilithonimonas arachidiradicis]RKE88360.1 hypothetical protein BXY58_1509 [Epilithonimonas arachidiradicis]
MRKIFYVPGLISACMIPILFWFYGNRKFEEVNVGVIDIVLPAKVHSTSSKEEKDRIYQNSFEPLRNWDYKKIVVKPNTARQNSDFYISEIKNLQQRNVKETGIEFIINDDNSYDDLISLLNDMAISKHEMYGLDLDKSGHFFALVNYRDPNTIEMEYECLLCNDVIYDEYKPSFFDDFQFYLQKFSKESFYLVFGFLIFVNISMLSIKESLQKH